MTNRLPGSKPSDDEGVTIGMDDINIVSVRLVKTNVRRVTLEERPSGVQSCDPAQVGQLLPHEPGDVGPEGEPDQVSVVVDGDPGLLADLVDEARHLFADQPGVDGGPHVVGVHGARRPVHADDVDVLHLEEGEPHLPGPDLGAAGPEAVDDELGRVGDVEVAGGDGGDVEKVQHLSLLIVFPGVEIEDSADLLRRGGEHVQVVEGPLVPEAAQLAIADHLLVSLLPSTLKFSQHIL